MRAIGIDVGGTFTRTAVIDSTGAVCASHRVATRPGVTGAGLRSSIADCIATVLRESGTKRTAISAIGLALPGIIDRERGSLLRSVNLPGLQGCPLRDELAAAVGLPVVLLTDAEAATWAEYSVCPRRPARFVHLRLGTGVACGVVIDGELLRLDEGRTTHLEVLVIDRSAAALSCRCGRRGCLETVACGAALSGEPVSSAGSFARSASDLADRAVAGLAVAFANLTERFSAEIISVGGWGRGR